MAKVLQLLQVLEMLLLLLLMVVVMLVLEKGRVSCHHPGVDGCWSRTHQERSVGNCCLLKWLI